MTQPPIRLLPIRGLRQAQLNDVNRYQKDDDKDGQSAYILGSGYRSKLA